MSKIGFKRSPTTSTRPGTTKRARPTVPPLPPPMFSDFAPRPMQQQQQQQAPTPERLAELHAAAFSALRSAVEANDDGLVRRMREWEDRYARRRSAPAACTPSTRRRRRRLASDPEGADMQLARSLPLPAAGDDDDDQLIIHTSPGAGLASCPPRPTAMAVDQPACAPVWASGPLPAFSARRISDGPFSRGSHNYVAYRNSSSCTSSSDDEDMVWESSSSPYLSATTTAASSDADADVDELGFQLAAGCGAIEDYSVDAILALQMQAAAAAAAAGRA